MIFQYIKNIAFIFVILLIYPALIFSQRKSTELLFDITNESGAPVEVDIKGVNQLIDAGQHKTIRRDLAQSLPFFVSVYQPDPAENGGFRRRQIRIFKDSVLLRKIIVCDSNKVELRSDAAEEIFDSYFSRLTRSGFWKLTDSFVSAYSNSVVAAEIIGSQLCRSNYDIDVIGKYFDKLSDTIRANRSGKLIGEYLASRKRFSIGAQAKHFTLRDSTGKLVSLNAIKAEWVLLDFWFSTCKPCIASFPALKEFYGSYNRDQLEIIGLSVDSELMKKEWKRTVRQHQLGWVNLHDPFSSVSYSDFAIENYPVQILLDKNRKIVLINPTIEEMKTVISALN